MLAPALKRKALHLMQGFTGVPLGVALFRHVTVTRAGNRLPASCSKGKCFHR